MRRHEARPFARRAGEPSANANGGSAESFMRPGEPPSWLHSFF